MCDGGEVEKREIKERGCFVVVAVVQMLLKFLLKTLRGKIIALVFYIW